MASRLRSPRIVVTLAVPGRDPNPGLALRKNALYLDSVVRHGGTAVPLDATASAADRAGAFASMDGLLISGGTDLDPALYDHPDNGSTSIDRGRDDLELAAFMVADRRDLPVLGICRGLQAMNVFSGGGLVQHLTGHSGPRWGSGPAHTHPIRIVPGTRFARIVAPAAIAETVIHVNSYHHQGVTAEHLAPAYVPTAWASSAAGDLVEAFEAPAGPFRVGIQCHPERTESTPRDLERLFASFVEACREPLLGR
jgi:putative glutamine amidotransferase